MTRQVRAVWMRLGTIINTNQYNIDIPKKTHKHLEAIPCI